MKTTMHRNILSFMFTLIAPCSFTQEQLKNTLSIEYYQPIQTPSLREFYNDEWILTPANDYTRHYFSNSPGLSFERILKNDFVLRPRIGVTFRKLTERNYTDQVNTGAQDITITEEYDYKQKHINLFLGFGKRIGLAKHVNLDLGLDLSSIFYLHGHTTYYSIIDYYIPGTTDHVGQDEYWWTNKVGRAFCVGIGPYIKPEYVFSNNITLSAELQFFFVYSGSRDKSITSSHRRIYWDPDSPIGEYLYEEASSGETKYNFGQWSWSRLSPLIRIGYKF